MLKHELNILFLQLVDIVHFYKDLRKKSFPSQNIIYHLNHPLIFKAMLKNFLRIFHEDVVKENEGEERKLKRAERDEKRNVDD